MRRRAETAAQTMGKESEKQSPLAPRVHRTQGRIRAIFSALCIAIVIVLFRKKSAGVLPMTYAICSRKDSSIYSVDENHPRPECIVISDAHIADRGSLEYIRTNWGDKYMNGPATASNPLAPKSGVKIYFLPSGHALFPGFSDSHAHVLGWPLVLLHLKRLSRLQSNRIRFFQATASVWVQIRRW
jgi:hypothetical protein